MPKAFTFGRQTQAPHFIPATQIYPGIDRDTTACFPVDRENTPGAQYKLPRETMMDIQLLPRLLTLSHLIIAAGVTAWYLGIFPQSTPERRFRPLGLYMAVTVGVELIRWASLVTGSNSAPLIVNIVAASAAGLLLLQAHRIATGPGENPAAWPVRLRVAFTVHLALVFLVPLSSASLAPIPDQSHASWRPLASMVALVWICLSNLSFLKRHGHQVQRRVVAGIVLLCSGITVTGFIILRDQNRTDQSILLAQADALAEIAQRDVNNATVERPDSSDHAQAALDAISGSSGEIAFGFVLDTTGDLPSYRATARNTSEDIEFSWDQATAENWVRRADPERSIVFTTTLADAAHESVVAISPIRHPETRELIGYLGLISSPAKLTNRYAFTVLVLEILALVSAFTFYAVVAGYLHAALRVSQRDALLAANAEISHRLLQSNSPHETAKWALNELSRQLHLVVSAFWTCQDTNGHQTFRVQCVGPSQNSDLTDDIHPWSNLPDSWLPTLSRGDTLEGPLRSIAPDVPSLQTDAPGNPWLVAQGILLHDKLWGVLILVSPYSAKKSREEIRSALRAIAGTFTFSLVRAEREIHLASAEEQLRTIIETSPDGFWDARFLSGEIYRSDQWWRMLGYERPVDEIKQARGIIRPEDLAKFDEEQFADGDPGQRFRRLEYQARHRDGTWRWIESNAVEQRSAKGPPDRVLGFDRDITERRQYEDRLQAAAESAAKANKAKSEFLATMSHELRTPLNSVLGFASVLANSPLNDSQQKWVGSMRTSAEQLLDLISEILDFSRIEAGKLELDITDFELRRAVEKSLEMFSRQATEKGLALYAWFEFPPGPIWVLGDTLRVRQILTNLVGNAVKFTTSGHIVVKTYRKSVGVWVFEVHDSGAGIPENQRETLFDRFSQADSSSTRPHSGAGLGLAISRELARNMNGDITVDHAPGGGSVFTVTLCLSEKDGDARRQSDKRLDLSSNIPILLGDELDREMIANVLANTDCRLVPFDDARQLNQYLLTDRAATTVMVPRAFRPEAEEAALELRHLLGPQASSIRIVGIQCAAADNFRRPNGCDYDIAAPMRRREILGLLGGAKHDAAPPHATKVHTNPPVHDALRVLVVEDHPTNRDVIGTMLKHLGVNAKFAENGRDALEVMQQHRFDLALVDIQMPELDGYGVAQWVRHSWPCEWAPPWLVAVTANAARGDKERCLDAGMDDYASKPITFGFLSELISGFSSNDSGSRGGASEGNPPQPPAPRETGQAPLEPDTAGPGDEWVDWEGFESIIMFTNAQEEPAILRRIIQTFDKDQKRFLNEIEELGTSDPEATRRLLHKLKGSSGSLSLLGIMDSIKKLHDEAELPSPEALHARVEHIRSQTQGALAAVHRRYPWISEG